MKGHKAHHHREARKNGGAADNDPKTGKKEWEADLSDKPEMRDNAQEIDKEATERKRGGRAKRKRGGEVKVEGMEAMHHAGRKPRKSGGRAGSDKSPLSSAHAGDLPPYNKGAVIN
jgi:hypothetical protein